MTKNEQIKNNMDEKEFDLLMKDLCGRLPYGVKVQHQHQDYLNEVQTIEHISRQYGEIETESVLGFVDDFKPYLRPMSSMTEEEWADYQKIKMIDWVNGDINGTFINTGLIVDWLNKNHFDYRGLIPKDLAIEVTKENNPYKGS